MQKKMTIEKLAQMTANEFGEARKEMKTGFDQLRGEMKAEFKDVRGELNGVRGELNGVKSELDGVKGELGGIKGELDGVKGELDGVKDELKDMKILIGAMYETVKSIDEGMVEVRTMKKVDIPELRADVDLLMEDMERVKQKVKI